MMLDAGSKIDLDLSSRAGSRIWFDLATVAHHSKQPCSVITLADRHHHDASSELPHRLTKRVDGDFVCLLGIRTHSATHGCGILLNRSASSCLVLAFALAEAKRLAGRGRPKSSRKVPAPYSVHDHELDRATPVGEMHTFLRRSRPFNSTEYWKSPRSGFGRATRIRIFLLRPEAFSAKTTDSATISIQIFCLNGSVEWRGHQNARPWLLSVAASASNR